MDCRGLLLGQKLARGLTLPAGQRILDVAGGSGVYACCLAAAWEGSSATVFEQPPVDAIARDAITRRGCAERVSVIAGNMFDDPWPTGFTMHLLSNVVHDWGIPKVRELFAKSAAALESGARIVIHDAHIEDTDDGPLAVAAYSALLMNITEGRCYRFGEMREWLDEAGFAVERVGPTGLARTYICAVRR
jgi:cyclopropane fatty-acyl-phospholipid synthase-like methyltransferase